MSKIKIHTDDEKSLMKRLGLISSSLCLVHIIGRRVTGNPDHLLLKVDISLAKTLSRQAPPRHSSTVSWTVLQGFFTLEMYEPVCQTVTRAQGSVVLPCRSVRICRFILGACS